MEESLWHLKKFDPVNLNKPVKICNVYAVSFEEAIEKMNQKYKEENMDNLKKDQIRLEQEDVCANSDKCTKTEKTETVTQEVKEVEQNPSQESKDS